MHDEGLRAGRRFVNIERVGRSIIDLQEDPKQAASQADDRAHGQIDPAGNDHERNPDAQQPIHRDTTKQVLDVVWLQEGAAEKVVPGLGGHDDHEHE